MKLVHGLLRRSKSASASDTLPAISSSLQQHGFSSSLLRLRLSKAPTESTRDPATSSQAVGLFWGVLPVCSSTVVELRGKVIPADHVGVKLVCSLCFLRPMALRSSAELQGCRATERLLSEKLYRSQRSVQQRPSPCRGLPGRSR